MGFLNRTCTLLSHGIKPIYVFDGRAPELKADEIASAILYLACDDSSFITGQWISPNGGLVTI